LNVLHRDGLPVRPFRFGGLLGLRACRGLLLEVSSCGVYNEPYVGVNRRYIAISIRSR
jgi:hypothetical protein